MRFYVCYRILFIFISLLLAAACAGEAPKAETPLEALKTYMDAFKKKDTTRMKQLLSEGSIKMAQEEAQTRGVTLDEVVKNETLFSEDQTKVEFKNQKIDGDRATIEVKNSFKSWDIVPFNRENGMWKIAKERYMEEQIKASEERNRILDQQIQQGNPDSMNPTMLPPASGVPDTSGGSAVTPAPMPTMQEEITPTPIQTP